MTHRLLVQYGHPTDPAAFDKHYREVHAGLARAIPGLQRFTIAHPTSLGGEAPYLVAELDWESEQAFGEGMGSEAGQAAGNDLGTFATGGASMSHFEIEDVTA